jgi:regulation of enolase protein 1 (concanavalin A-like superfamily)
MIRESLTGGSKHAFMGISPNGAFRWIYRNSTGGSTLGKLSVTATLPNIWVRLVRSGNILTAYRSTDGVRWSRVDTRTISMASNIYIGLAVASGSSTTLNTATMSNVTVVP